MCASPLRGAAVADATAEYELRLSAFCFRFFLSFFSFVIAGHSRSQNGVAKLAYAGNPCESFAGTALPPAFQARNISMDHRHRRSKNAVLRTAMSGGDDF